MLSPHGLSPRYSREPRVPVSPGGSDGAPASGGLRPDDELHVAIEYRQEPEELVDRHPVVRLIEQAVEVRSRRMISQRESGVAAIAR
jgi:hypothetical protein